MHNFNCLNGIPLTSGHHTVRSLTADFSKLMEQTHSVSRVFYWQETQEIPHLQEQCAEEAYQIEALGVVSRMIATIIETLH